MFTNLLGEDEPNFDEHIFQLGLEPPTRDIFSTYADTNMHIHASRLVVCRTYDIRYTLNTTHCKIS